MPIKHQSDSYRIRGGVRYKCFGDYCEYNFRKSARDAVKLMRKSGLKAFCIHTDSYSRVFVEDKK